MKILLVFSLFLVSVGGGESRTVRGYPGGGVLIKCGYKTNYTTSPKYLCKGPWTNCADQIKTRVKNEWRSTGRFSLLDNTRSAEFWVMIRDLTVQDSGLYFCAVEKAFFDVYTPVDLTVEKDPSYEKTIHVIGRVGGGVNISCKYPQSLSSHPKFLCRRVGTAECKYTTPVKESRRWIKEGNLNLHDDRARQTFTVSINSLTWGDSGEYWCGAESDWTSDDGYRVYITQIYLRVTGTPAVSPATGPNHLISTSSPPPSPSSPSPPAALPEQRDSPTGVAVFSSIGAGVVLVTAGLITVICCRMKHQGSVAMTQSSMETKGNFENAPASFPLHPTNNHFTNQSDSVYQSLNPNTNQSDSVYQSLNPNTNQSDSVYQSLNPNTNQSDSVYQSLNPNTNQSDSVYQSLNPRN